MTNPQAAMAGNISPRSIPGLSWSVQKNSRDQIEESPGFRLHLLSLNLGDMLMDCTLRLRHGILGHFTANGKESRMRGKKDEGSTAQKLGFLAPRGSCRAEGIGDDRRARSATKHDVSVARRVAARGSARVAGQAGPPYSAAGSLAPPAQFALGGTPAQLAAGCIRWFWHCSVVHARVVWGTARLGNRIAGPNRGRNR